ncbi:MAG: peptidoglycan DD-metalloendopeptidase family protein [Tidjanibacter sp.]|nr:peptidoglycan DD-metalloendopeptidase family protein [Tidjanibacter sp.]
MKTIKIFDREVRWEVPVIALSALVVVVVCAIKLGGGHGSKQDEAPVQKTELLYGYDMSKYDIVQGRVESGQTLSHVLEGHTSQVNINRIATEAKPTYDFRHMRVNDKYAIFSQSDSLGSHLRHFVFEMDKTNMVHVSLGADGAVSVRTEAKEVTYKRRKVSGTISSSLWNCLVENNIPPALAVEIEDIYGWSVDFFALHEGDTFTTIFDEKYIDGERDGIGTVWGSKFTHAGKDYYAIPFVQEGKLSYWDENGKSMRKQFLKAPLKFTRISSKFSNSRMHPILKIRRPHHGVDYAAPKGTPVVAIADGTVTAKYWDSKGGGNVLKLKHTNGYTSSYLHLSGYAKGIYVGKRVSQGEKICYVGSTGHSTGPHLDFRVYKNGKPIDPLKIPSNPVEPIKKENTAAFEDIKTRVLAELEGDVRKKEQVGRYDLYPDSRTEIKLSHSDSVKMRIEEGALWQALEKVK